MKISAKQYAAALVESTAEASAAQTKEAVAFLVEELTQVHREDLLPKIIRGVDGAWRKKFGSADVYVKSAFPLSKATLEKITSAAPGADVHASVDPQLIGGVTIRFDDQLLDASISGELQRLSASLTHGS